LHRNRTNIAPMTSQEYFHRLAAPVRRILAKKHIANTIRILM
jgi:hypothetical protein